MSKYEPLAHFLKSKGTSEVPMRFAEIERVIGGKLPPAAHTHRAWWSNNPSNNVMTRAWLSAGYISERVDMAGEQLVFRRQIPSSTPSKMTESQPAEAHAKNWLADLRARLSGVVTFVDGVDLTAPTGEVWDAEQ